MNVYEFEGKDKFHKFYDSEVLQALVDKYPADRAEIEPRLEYYRKLALHSIFGEDPENESLEEEK